MYNGFEYDTQYKRQAIQAMTRLLEKHGKGHLIIALRNAKSSKFQDILKACNKRLQDLAQ